MTAEDFNRIYDPDAIVKSETDEKIMSEITHIITSVILSVTIDNNGAPIAKFILDALESNDMFYDSDAMVLKDKENWTEEKLVKWSTMAGYSSLTDYNCIHRFSNFKVTGKDSEMNDANTDQVFELDIHLPKMEGEEEEEVANPNNLCLLVHHDDKLSFANEGTLSRFKYLARPHSVRYTVTDNPKDGYTVKFLWEAQIQNASTHETDVKVTLFLNPKNSNNNDIDDFKKSGIKKIGSTTSFKKTVGPEGYIHFTYLKIRKAISLGIEDVSSVEESVATFLETLFHLVFQISDLDFSVISRSQLANSSDEVANMFYKNIMISETSAIYKVLMESERGG